MDSEKLEIKIKERGIQKKFLAKELGISQRAFSNKMTGKTCFKSDEMQKLFKLLSMTRKEYFDIFLLD